MLALETVAEVGRNRTLEHVETKVPENNGINRWYGSFSDRFYGMQSISYTLIMFRFWTVSQIAFTADGIAEKQLRLKSLKTAKAAGAQGCE